MIANSERVDSQVGYEAEDYESLVLYLVHDLEGPLAAMQTLLRLLDSGRFDPKRELQARLLKSTHAAMNRARLIVSDMLRASQLEEGALRVELQEFPVIEVIDDCIQLVQMAAFEQEVSVVTDIDDRQLSVRADRQMLSRVLDNLLFNAVRHSNHDGVVRLRVVGGEGRVIISIINGGQGLGEIDPAELFEKFKQVQHRKNMGHRGAGLGLYFCKLAMDAMHGEINANQTETGETCFSVSITGGGNKR
jgi:signal transduction histidine kinase